MPVKPLIVLVVFALGAAPAAWAQNYGHPTPGICFITKQRILDQTNAGAAANQRIEMFRQAIAQELSGERAAIAADANVLQIQKPVISEAIYQQRAGALALREQSFQTLENIRNDQLARTRAKITARLIRELAPILAGALSEHSCSAVFESTGAYAFNPTMDLTNEVILAMNAKLGPIDFGLEPEGR
jgi:Skp family chaperone for outer membrane proteins